MEILRATKLSMHKVLMMKLSKTGVGSRRRIGYFNGRHGLAFTFLNISCLLWRFARSTTHKILWIVRSVGDSVIDICTTTTKRSITGGFYFQVVFSLQ